MAVVAAATLVPGHAGATIVAWKNPSTGSWNTSTNWSPNGVPTAGDDVKIAVNASPYDVQLAQAFGGPSGSARSVEMSASNARLVIDRRTLDVVNNVLVTNGELRVEGNLRNPAALNAANVTIFSSGRVVVHKATAKANVVNHGALALESAFLPSTDPSGNLASFTNNGNTTMFGAGTFSQISAVTTNNGTFIVSGGGVNGLANFTNEANATLRIEATASRPGPRLGIAWADLMNHGRFEMGTTTANSNSVTLEHIQNVHTGRLVNGATGVIDVQAGGTRTMRVGVDNHGLMDVREDLKIEGAFNHSNSGTLDLGLGTTTQFNGGGFTFTNEPTGVIRGNGALDVSNINFVDNGTTSPGNSFGTLEFIGGYVQGTGAVLDLEIGGLLPPLHDQLIITGGTGTFDGLLRLTFVDGFAPSEGNVLELITTGLNGIVNANFSGIELINLEPGFDFDTAVGSTGFSLTALNDGVFSPPGNGSGVPEPGTLLLLASGLLLLPRRGRLSEPLWSEA